MVWECIRRRALLRLFLESWKVLEVEVDYYCFFFFLCTCVFFYICVSSYGGGCGWMDMFIDIFSLCILWMECNIVIFLYVSLKKIWTSLSLMRLMSIWFWIIHQVKTKSNYNHPHWHAILKTTYWVTKNKERKGEKVAVRVKQVKKMSRKSIQAS